MVREVDVTLPGIGGDQGAVVKAIAFQDLPGRAVGTFHAVEPNLRGTVGLGLLSLAVGDGVDLDIYTYSELTEMFDRWQDASLDLEDGSGESVAEVDWGGLL